jgi:hypothetical protein
LNQPGDPDYRPGDPWFRNVGGKAAGIYSYDDDNRETAPQLRGPGWPKLFLNSVSRDARKRRYTAQEPIAWPLSVVQASKTDVTKLVSQERLDKTRIRWINDYAEVKGIDIPHRKLESCRGFIVWSLISRASITHWTASDPVERQTAENSQGPPGQKAGPQILRRRRRNPRVRLASLE